MVTNKNTSQNCNFFNKFRINLYCSSSIKKYIEQIKIGIGHTIPL